MSKKYKAKEFVRCGGTLYSPGDNVPGGKLGDKNRINELVKRGVIAAKGSKAEDETGKDPVEIDLSKSSRDYDDWRAVVAHIESAPVDELEGFVGEDEDRKSVLNAWEKKLESEE